MRQLETDVIVVGGGATGAGTVRDCAIRGIRSVLVEKNDLASGTTGRNHGLLHSGARYAVKDAESAEECIAENRILKRIAHHCIEDTGGLFVTLPGDDPGYHFELLQSCKKAGIDCKEISIKEARRIEPNLNSKIVSALKVPDATVDPFRLVSANVLDAGERAAEIFTHTEVVRLIRNRDRIVGVRCQDQFGSETFEIFASIVVNASGVWAERLCKTADIELNMFPSKGSLVIFDYRVNRVVVNACRLPTDADIMVPGDTVSLIGTTSKKVPYDKIDYAEVDDDEIEILLDGAEKLIPNVSKTRLLRSYCGVRPLISLTSGEADGRNITRGIVLVDHEERDGLKGLVTIAGGKLMTYRLMAERATDLICRKLGIKKACTTHKKPLPGSEKKIAGHRKVKFFSGLANSVVGSTHYRHGERVHRILKKEKRNYGLICECEIVTEGELEYALKHLNAKDIVDLRRRTRIGMGPCQGALCAYRTAGLITELSDFEGTDATRMLVDFLEERWKGIKTICWGDSLRESEFSYWIYQGLISEKE